MIDKYKIEKAARSISDNVADGRGFDSQKPTDISYLEGHCAGFITGANWAIEQFLKDLWHSTKEEPEEGGNILIEHKWGNLYYHTEHYDCYYDDPWDVKVRTLNITRWLYIDDLIPKEGDDSRRIRKA